MFAFLRRSIAPFFEEVTTSRVLFGIVQLTSHHTTLYVSSGLVMSLGEDIGDGILFGCYFPVG